MFFFVQTFSLFYSIQILFYDLAKIFLQFLNKEKRGKKYFIEWLFLFLNLPNAAIFPLSN